MLSIDITTFKKRYHMLSNMVDYIRKCDSKIPINITINGEIEEEFDEVFRKNILGLCLKYENIYPIFFQEFRALSKAWNTLVIFSKTEYNLILNDDLVFNQSYNLVDIIKKAISENKSIECFNINNSWSHYVITKSFLDKMNYFDERLLLHGEEDGDFVWRYI